MKTLTLNKYGKEHPMSFALNRYCDNGNLYVGLVTHENGYAESWQNLSVNLGKTLDDNYVYIDINNNGREIINWLCENGLGWLTGAERRSGFCVYPEFEFNMEKLLEYVSSGDHVLHYWNGVKVK